MKQAILPFVKYAIPFITLGIVSYDLYDKNQYRENIQNEKINVVVSAVISSYTNNKVILDGYKTEKEYSVLEHSFSVLSTEHLENILQTQGEFLEKCNLFSDLFELNNLIVKYNLSTHTQQIWLDDMMGKGFIQHKIVPRKNDNEIFFKYGVVGNNLVNCISKYHDFKSIKMSHIGILRLIKENSSIPLYKVNN